jgi:glutaredoxin
MSETYLFTTSWCPQCPAAKNFVNENNLDVTILEVDTSEDAMLMANQYGVSSVPQFVEVTGHEHKNYFLAEYMQHIHQS